jgi:hypothetical protein
MILNEKSLNYKFINLDEIYNFHTTFISIRTQTKKIMIFWKLICPYPRPKRRQGLPHYPGATGSSLRPFEMR